MQKLTVTDESGRQHEIYYTFVHEELENNRFEFNGHRRYATTCFMSTSNENHWRTWNFAMSINSKNDQWSRKRGNIISFSRVLREIVEDKNLRRKFFSEFWKVHGRKLPKGKFARVSVTT